MLEVRLLGQFDVRRGDAPIVIPSRAAQSLFAYLILTAGTPHRREQLAGLLWPDTTEENARSNLRHELWRLRNALDRKRARKGASTYLVVDEMSIAFDATSDYWLDSSLLSQPLADRISVEELIGTLSLYRGELLPGWYDDWVVLERQRLCAIFEQKMERLLELLVKEQRWQETLDWGERWIALGQTPEPAYRALIAAHYALGNVSQMALAYGRCKQAMDRDYGVEPSQETQALFERLSRPEKTTADGLFRPAGESAWTELQMAPTSTALATLTRHPRPLPVPLTSFVGRERERVEVSQLLSGTRLLTLVGAGGVGKTRLAIQVATEVQRQFKDGACWVELAALGDPALVPQAVGKALALRDEPNVPMIDTLGENLRSSQALLLLDGCEHLVGACAELAESLLRTCGYVKILATSREPLGISGETVWRVPSLSLPELKPLQELKDLNKYESIRLFVERARAVKTRFSLTEENADALMQVCRRLDGIPLALELAAARANTLSADQIAARLNDRFQLLTRGSRTALPRHQTLRATTDWSYDLLSEPEKGLFRRLGVFAGGWTLEAAERVCTGDGLEREEVFERLARLVDKSLVIAEEHEREARYRMLETIRQYANEKLVEAEQDYSAHLRHLDFYLAIAEECERNSFSPEQSVFLDRLEAEIDNLRAAVDWALKNHQVIAALRLVSSMQRFWFMRAYPNEGLERLKLVLGLPEASQSSPERLKGLNAYLLLLWPSGRLSEFQPLIDEALELSATFGDRWNSAFALIWQGVSTSSKGDYALARSQLELSLAMYEDLNDRTYSGWVLAFLGEVASLQGDVARAQACYEQALPKLEGTKDIPFLAIPLRRLGQLALSQNKLVRAKAFLERSLADNWRLHDYRGVGACLAALGALSMAQGETLRAIVLFGAVATILETVGALLLPFDQQQYDRNLAAARAQADPATFEAALADGHAMSLEQAVAYALEASQLTS